MWYGDRSTCCLYTYDMQLLTVQLLLAVVEATEAAPLPKCEISSQKRVIEFMELSGIKDKEVWYVSFPTPNLS